MNEEKFNQITNKTIDLSVAYSCLMDWAKVTLSETECRGDDECDHCFGLSIISEIEERIEYKE